MSRSLSGEWKKVVQVLLSTILIIGCQKESATPTPATFPPNPIPVEDNAKPPTVSTREIVMIHADFARSGGEVIEDGGNAVTKRGVVWSSAHLPTIDTNNKTTDGQGKGSFNSTLSGLTPNTEYKVRAYATNKIGTSYGDNIIFKTTGPPTLPTVFTLPASSVTQTGFTGGGVVAQDGNTSVTARGIV